MKHGKNFTGASGYLDVNCAMVKRALCAALGLLGASLPAVAQQAHSHGTLQQLRSAGALNAPLALSLYRPKISSAADSSLLLHNGTVPLWLDGPQVSTGVIDPGYNFVSQWAQMVFTSSDLFPVASLNAAPVAAQKPNTDRYHDSDGKNLGTDGKDSLDEITSPSTIYYGGEIGVLYGRWSGKGGGDMWQTYVEGTVGNDKFQITAGAAYEEWSGRGTRLRSFAVPR
jgi:hypothetical protein